MSASGDEGGGPPVRRQHWEATAPLDSLDKACLAATSPPWSSFAPTWKLDLRGDVDVARLDAALQQVARRYPMLGATLAGEGWAVPAAPVVPFGEVERDEVVLDRFLDVSREPLCEVRWVRLDGGVRLLFHQHHALADGRAFLEFLGDFFATVREFEANGPPVTLAVVPRRRQREVVETQGLRWWLDALRGAWASLAELVVAVVRPVDALRCNVGQDFESGNRTLHLEVPLARLDAWKARRHRHGLSTNDLLAGALLRALTPWSTRPLGRHTLFLPVDVRPREGFRSFANHLSGLQLGWTADPSMTALGFARHVHEEAGRQTRARRPWVRVPFDDALGRLTPLGTLRQAIHERRRLLTNFSFSNLLPLGTPRGPWATGTMRVERLRITTPCVPPQAVNLTVVRSGEAACFNFNFKPSAMAEVDVERLVERFTSALDELDRDLG